MKPSQAFGVVVRVFGLLAWVASLVYVLSAVTVFVAPNYRSDAAPWAHYLFSAAIWFVIGWFLLRRAKRVVAFAYRLSASDATDV
jgi:hypothetical protein